MLEENWYKGYKNLWGFDEEEDVEIDFIDPEPLEEETEEE